MENTLHWLCLFWSKMMFFLPGEMGSRPQDINWVELQRNKITLFTVWIYKLEFATCHCLMKGTVVLWRRCRASVYHSVLFARPRREHSWGSALGGIFLLWATALFPFWGTLWLMNLNISLHSNCHVWALPSANVRSLMGCILSITSSFCSFVFAASVWMGCLESRIRQNWRY